MRGGGMMKGQREQIGNEVGTKTKTFGVVALMKQSVWLDIKGIVIFTLPSFLHLLIIIMTAYPSLNLPRFSGSTLEPTVEPVAFVPSYHSSANSSALFSPSSLYSADSSTMDEDNDFILPLSSLRSSSSANFSLNRPNRPTFIDIPSTCKSFSLQQYSSDIEELWSPSPQAHDYYTEPEFHWDESGQTVYKRSHPPHRHPQIFWSA